MSGVEAMLEPPCSQEGFLTRSSAYKLQQEIPQLFLHYLLMLLLSFLTWHTMFFSLLPCSCTVVFQIGSCRSDGLAKLCSLLLHSCLCLLLMFLMSVWGTAVGPAALVQGFAVIIMKC